MAKATDKNSASAPRGLSLAFYCAQLRGNRCSRSETLQRLTERLTAEGVEVSPPLPPDWHLEFDPEDRLWLMWPDGRRMARDVWLYENPFKPVPPSAAVMRALYPDDEEPPSEPSESAAATAVPPPVTTPPWWLRSWAATRTDSRPIVPLFRALD